MNPFIHIQDPPEQRFFEQEKPSTKVEMGTGFNMDFFTKGNVSIKTNSSDVVESTPPAKKRGRPRKEDTSGMVTSTGDNNSNNSLSYTQNNVPYQQSFNETNEMLKTSIYQIDALNSEVHAELENVRNSRTLKGRYTYISDLSSTASSLLNTKISAIREMNKSIVDAHKLDLDRIKALKLDQKEQNDDMQIQALYNAYINTPINADYNPLSYDPKAALMPSSMANIVRAEVNGSDDGYNNFINNITPEQNRMLLESNPNIKTVVVYDQSNPNNRFFDVIDITTGQSVPNYPRPDNLFLEDTVINPLTGLARNSNIDATWPVVVIGTDAENANLENF